MDDVTKMQQLARRMRVPLPVEWKRRLVRRVQIAIRDAVKTEAPVGVGNPHLRDLITFKTTPSGEQGRVISGSPHSGYVFFGTPPHVIRPRAGKALSFVMGGKRIIVRSVQHPGTRPNRYMIRGLVGSKDRRRQIYQEEARRLLRDLAKGGGA